MGQSSTLDQVSLGLPHQAQAHAQAVPVLPHNPPSPCITCSVGPTRTQVRHTEPALRSKAGIHTFLSNTPSFLLSHCMWLHVGHEPHAMSCELLSCRVVRTPHSNTTHCSTAHALQSSTHCAAQHCTALSCTVLHCAAMHCTTLHCTALHCAAMRCSAPHCITHHAL